MRGAYTSVDTTSMGIIFFLR